MNDETRQAQGKFVMSVINACRDIITEGENFLNVLGKPYTQEQPKTEQPTQAEINSLKSTEKTGVKGTYKLISKSENPNNPAFDNLRKYITEHNGFLKLHGHKYWNFSNSPDLIGKR